MLSAALVAYRFVGRVRGRFSEYAKKRAALKKARELAASRSSRRIANAFALDEFDEEARIESMKICCIM